MAREQSILRKYLIPLLFVMLLQSALFGAIIEGSGVVQLLDKNTVHILHQTAYSRKVSLENQMARQWSQMDGLIHSVEHSLAGYLGREQLSWEQFQTDTVRQKEYLTELMEGFIVSFRQQGTTGAFIILDNKLGQERYNGIYVRDSNPINNPGDSSDLILERGPAEISHRYQIALDSLWGQEFDFSDETVRQKGSYDYFYKPYQNGLANPERNDRDLGCWIPPFCLNSENADSYQMIVYAVPLIDSEGRLYGVAGVEISVQYLASLLPAREISEDNVGGYLLVEYEENDRSTARVMLGVGSALSRIAPQGTRLDLEQTEHGIYRLAGLELNEDSVYADYLELQLYNSNRAEVSQWALLAVAGENMLFGIGDRLQGTVLITIAICVLVTSFAISYTAIHLTQPIRRLVECIRDSRGKSRLPDYYSGIKEVDELYKVIGSLTDKQRQTAAALKEESERYLMALRSSMDTIMEYEIETDRFIIYDFDENRTDILRQEFFGFRDLVKTSDKIHDEDRETILSYITAAKKNGMLEFRAKLPLGNKDFQWFEIKARTICDEENKPVRMIANVKNISRRKEQEAGELAAIRTDPVTGLLRRKVGEYQIRREVMIGRKGCLLLTDIDGFGGLNTEYGIIMGDLLLEEIGLAIQRHIGDREVAVRFGGDEFLIWAPGITIAEGRKLAEAILQETNRLYQEESFRLTLSAGIASMRGNKDFDSLLQEARTALEWVKHTEKGGLCCYDELDAAEKSIAVDTCGGIDEIASLGMELNQSIAMLAFNIFEKLDDTADVLPVLLSKVGRAFGLSKIMLLRCEEQSFCIECEWCKDKNAQSRRGVCYQEGEEERLFHTDFYFYMKEDGKIIGKLLAASEPGRKLSREGKNQLEQIAKIITSNVAKLRLSRQADERRETLLAKLDEMELGIRQLAAAYQAGTDSEAESLGSCIHNVEEISAYIHTVILEKELSDAEMKKREGEADETDSNSDRQ